MKTEGVGYNNFLNSQKLPMNAPGGDFFQALNQILSTQNLTKNQQKMGTAMEGNLLSLQESDAMLQKNGENEWPSPMEQDSINDILQLAENTLGLSDQNLQSLISNGLGNGKDFSDSGISNDEVKAFISSLMNDQSLEHKSETSYFDNQKQADSNKNQQIGQFLESAALDEPLSACSVVAPKSTSKEETEKEKQLSNNGKENNLMAEAWIESILEQTNIQLPSQSNGSSLVLETPKLIDSLSNIQAGNESLLHSIKNLNPVTMQMMIKELNLSKQTSVEAIGKNGNSVHEKSEAGNTMESGQGETHSIETLITSLVKNSSQTSQPAGSTPSLKVDSLFDSLSEQRKGGNLQNSGGFNGIKEETQSNVPIRNFALNQKYFGSTFSRAVTEMNDSASAEKVPKSNNSRIISSDWKNAGSLFFQQMSKPEQFVLMTQGPKQAASVNDMIQQFETILAKSQFSKTNGTQKLSINLHPENLGSLRIELIQKDQTTVARILTTTEAAKDALESHLNSLKDAFAAQNIPINKVEVGAQLTQGEQTRFTYSDGQQQSDHNNHENRQENNNRDKDDTDSGFILTLDEVLLNKTV